MQLISAQTLTSASASVTFSSIPQTFTDLKLVISARITSGGAPNVCIRFNSDSGANYSYKTLFGDGSSASSYDQSATGNTFINIGYSENSSNTANTFGNMEIYIPNYISSNYKSTSSESVQENNATTAYSMLTAGLWNNTSAITGITLVNVSGGVTFAIGSSFYLYGISSDTANQNTSGPYAFGGDTITTDGTYWYHTFLNSNSFTPQKNLSDVDFLVVAGGGSGGGTSGGGGGGGGAGGLRSSVSPTGGGGSAESKLSLTAGTVYAAVVGAGGAGVSGDNGSKGSDSIFSTVTSTGGGYGAKDVGSGANNGGSGGSGGGSAGGVGGTGGTGTTNQGYAGGNADRGAGGGSGGAASTTTAGTYVTNSISGTSTNYAAGGGAYGLNGGGAGAGNGASINVAPSAATANTGSGGAGSHSSGSLAGSNGGSGIIIVRYAV